jgi:serine protease Do
MYTSTTVSCGTPGTIADAGPTPRQRSATRFVATSVRPIFVVVALALAIASFVLRLPLAHADAVAIDEKVKHSLVDVWVVWTGWVEIPGTYMKSGQSEWQKTVAQSSCTGFVVDAVGFIATAGHCVDNTSEETKAMLRQQMVNDSVRQGLLPAATADSFLQHANSEQWLVEGHDRGAPIERKVQIMQPDGPARVIDHWTTVQVVQFQNMNQGDNALLNLTQSKQLEPLVVSDKVPPSGEALTVVGFPGNVGNITDDSRVQQPSFTAGTVSGQQVLDSGVPVTEVSANFMPGMSGGPAISSDGDVVGVISQGFGTRGTNFITNAPGLRTFLQQNGVHLAEHPKPAPAPAKSSFPWIPLIIALGAVIVVLAPTTMVLILRRSKRHSAAAQQANVPQPGGSQPTPVQTGPEAAPQPVETPVLVPAQQQSPDEGQAIAPPLPTNGAVVTQ